MGKRKEPLPQFTFLATPLLSAIKYNPHRHYYQLISKAVSAISKLIPVALWVKEHEGTKLQFSVRQLRKNFRQGRLWVLKLFNFA